MNLYETKLKLRLIKTSVDEQICLSEISLKGKYFNENISMKSVHCSICDFIKFFRTML